MSSVNRKPRVLCLGMSYPCVSGTIERYMDKKRKDNTERYCDRQARVFVKYISDLVQARIFTAMDGRDLVRCQATEKICCVKVFCVSQEKAAVYHTERHLEADFNGRDFVNELKDHVGEYKFDQLPLIISGCLLGGTNIIGSHRSLQKLWCHLLRMIC